MDIILRNRLARGIALIPVGIGSVMSTIYLTNMNKPLDLLDFLNFSDRPDIEETKIIPIVFENSPNGEGASPNGATNADVNSPGGTGDSLPQPPSENEGEKSGESSAEEQAQETPEAQSEDESPTEDFAGTEPTVVLKQVVNNLSNFDFKSKVGMATIDWLIKNLKQGALAAQYLKVAMAKKAKESQNSEGDSAVVTDSENKESAGKTESSGSDSEQPQIAS